MRPVRLMLTKEAHGILRDSAEAFMALQPLYETPEGEVMLLVPKGLVRALSCLRRAGESLNETIKRLAMEGLEP